VEGQHLNGCSLRLFRLRADGLAPQVSIERTDRMLVYGHNKLMLLCSHLAKTSLP
jgi:hypothetical protein